MLDIEVKRSIIKKVSKVIRCIAFFSLVIPSGVQWYYGKTLQAWLHLLIFNILNLLILFFVWIFTTDFH